MFKPGRETTDAVFIVRQIQEKYLDVGKPEVGTVWFLLVWRKHLKGFQRKVIEYVPRKKGLTQWMLSGQL